MRFYPSFEGLKFDNAFTHPSISKSLMLATGTSIALDKGKSIGLANAGMVASAHANDDEKKESKSFCPTHWKNHTYYSPT